MAIDPHKSYRILYADVPWPYNDRLQHHGGGAESHYPVIKIPELMRLDVTGLAAKDCVLFFWATGPQQDIAHEMLKAWGFRFRTVAFTWVKLNQKKRLCKLSKRQKDRLEWAQRFRSFFYGLGRWTRGNPEDCLLAVRGKPKRLDDTIKQLIFHRRMLHSAKPPCTRGRIVRLMGDVPRLELFARECAPGWDATGLEYDGEDIRDWI